MPFCTIIPDVFSAEECQRIIEQGKVLAAHQGAITSDNDLYADRAEVRRCEVAWFAPDQADFQWAHAKLEATISWANQQHWNYDLDGEKEFAQFTIYHPGDHFEWHMDLGDKNVQLRKLAAVAQLNGPEDYQGGSLQLHVQKSFRDVPKETGSVIVFPAYTMHRVIPVTEGVRYSLVQWMSGSRPYR